MRPAIGKVDSDADISIYVKPQLSSMLESLTWELKSAFTKSP